MTAADAAVLASQLPPSFDGSMTGPKFGDKALNTPDLIRASGSRQTLTAWGNNVT